MEDDFTPLETKRLRLRRFQLTDLEVFQAYRADPSVAAYQSWTERFSMEDARWFIERQLEITPGELGSDAQLAIELKASGAMIGDVFLNTPKDQPHQAHIGYTLARRHQGHGYASEAVQRVLDHAFRVLGKHRVSACTYAENERSVALLERIGMRREAHFVQTQRFQDRWVDEYVYGLLRSEWCDR